MVVSWLPAQSQHAVWQITKFNFLTAQAVRMLMTDEPIEYGLVYKSRILKTLLNQLGTSLISWYAQLCTWCLRLWPEELKFVTLFSLSTSFWWSSCWSCTPTFWSRHHKTFISSSLSRSWQILFSLVYYLLVTAWSYSKNRAPLDDTLQFGLAIAANVKSMVVLRGILSTLQFRQPRHDYDQKKKQYGAK